MLKTKMIEHIASQASNLNNLSEYVLNEKEISLSFGNTQINIIGQHEIHYDQEFNELEDHFYDTDTNEVILKNFQIKNIDDQYSSILISLSAINKNNKQIACTSHIEIKTKQNFLLTIQ